MMKFISSTVAALLISGCATLDHGPEPTTQNFTEPASSGLVAVRGYPTPDDVCEVIGENSLTSEFLDDHAILIGCPKHEKGAIADRLAENGQIVAHARHWTLISVPVR